MLLQIDRNKVDFVSDAVLAPVPHRMWRPLPSPRRALAAAALLVILAVLAIEAVHGAHHGGGLSSETCATCVVARTTVVPTSPVRDVDVSVVTTPWYDRAACCERTLDTIGGSASRAPPARA